MNKQVLGGMGIVLALVLGIIGVFKNPSVQVLPTQKFGGTSPEIASPYLRVNGLSKWYAETTLIQASTTVCAIQTPAATTTLVFGSLDESVSSTSASIIEIGNSSVPDSTTGQYVQATTTLIGTKYAVAANAAVDIVASSTPTNGKSTTFGPNDWFIIKQAVGNGGAIANPTGFCAVELDQSAY